MAYDFPASPTDGQEFTPPGAGQTYIWKAPRWLVKGIPPVGGGGGGGGIEEAPIDTKQYARQDAAWSEVVIPPPPSTAWADITGKPTTFPPTVPIQWDDIAGEPATYPPMLPIPWTDVSGKPTTFPPSAHVHAQSDVTNLSLDLTPAGSVIDYAGVSAPAGWLFCFGQSLLRADYPNLFAAISTIYGSADATHFTLPDCRGRVVAGKDNMGGTSADRLTAPVNGDLLGAVGGLQNHPLVLAELAAHSHTFTGTAVNTDTEAAHTHTFSATTSSDAHTHTITGTAASAGAHAHDYFKNTGGSLASPANTANTGTSVAQTSSEGAHTHTVSGSTSSDSHTHTVSGTSGSGGSHAHSVTPAGTNSSVGSGTAHNNMQPTIVFNKIIRAY